jgi:hypothetical protein
MDRAEQYRVAVSKVLHEYAQYKLSFGDIDVELVLDTEHDHYILVNAGWREHRRVYGSVIHVDIKDNKIWIQHDGTESGVANDLVELGIPKEDIILACYPEYHRRHTGFGVN